jgi:hypothetical protein
MINIKDHDRGSGFEWVGTGTTNLVNQINNDIYLFCIHSGDECAFSSPE